MLEDKNFDKKKWDKQVKELFMTKEEKEQEKKRQENIKKGEHDLIKYLDGMDRNFIKNNYYNKVDYDKIFDDELNLKKKSKYKDDIGYIRNIAKLGIDDDINDARTKIYNDHSKKYAKYANDVKDIDDDERDEIASIKAKYRKNHLSIMDNALRNGMYNSSCKDEAFAKAKDDAKDELYNIKNMSNTKRQKIENELDRMSKEREIALKNLDIKKSNELDKRMSEIARDLKKKNDDITTYNNKVDDMQSNYKIRRQRAIKSLENMDSENRRADARLESMSEDYTGAKQQNYQQRLDMAINFYNQLTREEALNSIRNNARLQYLLGKYYKRLLSNQLDR